VIAPHAMTPRAHEAVTSLQTSKGKIVKKTLTKMQKAVLGLALVPMVAVGVAGGVGTYSNISHAYGKGTAIGALAAGEGATAVLALLLLGLTMLGQSSPLIIRLGLWALPAAAAVMGATAADEGPGQTVVYAVTPMAITASAEGLAFLVRRIVVHQEGGDVEAEARSAAVIRDLAYHQARAATHPSNGARKRSVRRSWKLARKVGTGDAALGTQLLDIQRTRLVAGADTALERMFTPGMKDSAPALSAASAGTTPALLAASADDVMSSRAHESSIQGESSGYPADNTSEQAEEARDDRPSLTVVREEGKPKKSIAEDVRQMVRDGVQDVRHVIDALATRHGRSADDPTFQQTVRRSWRQAKAGTASETSAPGQYL
jgi:hypothetical protein